MSSDWNEDDLVALLSGVLLVDLEEEIDGLDEDLVQYIAGLVSTQLQETSTNTNDGDTSAEEEILDESMVPFLESVGCPSGLIEKAKSAVLDQAAAQKAGIKNLPSSSDGGAKKLKQGIVNMSSTLSEQSKEEASRYHFGSSDEVVKANANTQKDAYSDKSSAKDRRKQRQELEKVRRDLERANEQHETSTKSGVSAMVLPTVKGKDMDINVQDITLSLDNGTVLMDHGDLKFAYKRRYAIIGENGVARKTSRLLPFLNRTEKKFAYDVDPVSRFRPVPFSLDHRAKQRCSTASPIGKTWRDFHAIYVSCTLSRKCIQKMKTRALWMQSWNRMWNE